MPSKNQNPHINSLTSGVRAMIVEPVRWNPLDLPLLRKLVNRKQTCIPRGSAERSVPFEGLKDAGIVISTMFSF